MATISRRKLLSVAGAGVGAFFLPSGAAAELLPKEGRRIVVLGGGWGGATAARYAKLLAPEIEVVLIEAEDAFRSCPTSNWVIGGLWTMQDITIGYHRLQRNHGIKVIRDRATAIDPAAKDIRLTSGRLSYDRLILSPGIDLIYDGIEGMDEGGRARFPAAWKAGAETQALRVGLEKMPAGGTVAMTVPLGPYRCPPGPYERASLIAAYLKKHKPGSRLVVLDANKKIISKGKLFKAAWDDLYADVIDYRTEQELIGVDAGTGVIKTAFDEIATDVGNVIPAQRAKRIVFDAGLVPKGRRWAPVKPMTFESTIAEGVHIIGDATDQATVGRVPKSGFVANSMGKVAAAAAVAMLKGEAPPRPSLANTCYSLVSASEGISVTALYKWDGESGKFVVPAGAKGLSPGRSEIVARNARDWAQAIWGDMLG